MTQTRPTVRNLKREQAEEFRPGDNTTCISISQPGEPAHLSRQFWSVLRLEFADWDLDRYPRGSTNPAHAVLFTEQMARRVRGWAEAVRGAHIVVHCDAGVSRSAAVAVVLLEAFPEYRDAGGYRSPNTYVRRLLRQAFGLPPKTSVLTSTPGEKSIVLCAPPELDMGAA